MDSRLVRIFCANSPSQQARGASYNFLLLLRKDCLFCHRSECYGPPSPSISLESIKSLVEYTHEKRRGYQRKVGCLQAAKATIENINIIDCSVMWQSGIRFNLMWEYIPCVIMSFGTITLSISPCGRSRRISVR